MKWPFGNLMKAPGIQALTYAQEQAEWSRQEVERQRALFLEARRAHQLLAVIQQERAAYEARLKRLTYQRGYSQ